MTTWLQHVKKVHASGSTSFKESLKRASASWKKGKAATGDKKAPKKKQGRKQGAAARSTAAPEAKSKDFDFDAPTTHPPSKKKRRRKKKAMPKISRASLKNIDSVNL